MPEERYWIIHRRTGTAIYADRCGRPAPPALHQTARASVPVDSLVARVTTSARRHGRAVGGLATLLNTLDHACAPATECG